MFCENCGSKLDADAKFCRSCGKPVASNEIVKTSTKTSSLEAKKDKNWLTRLYQGRIGRKNWILGIIFWFAIILIGLFCGVLLLSPDGSSSDLFVWFFFVIDLAFLFLVFSLTIRRLHDLNDTGWKVLLFIIPLVNLITLIWLLGTKGTEGENQYGDQPSSEVGFFNSILGK